MNPRSGVALLHQQFLELLKVGGDGVPDPWHGDSPEQAARTEELDSTPFLIRVPSGMASRA